MSEEHLEGEKPLVPRCHPVLEWTSVSPGPRSLSLKLYIIYGSTAR